MRAFAVTALVVLAIFCALMGQRVLPACSGILAFSCGPPPPAGAGSFFELWLGMGQSNEIGLANAGAAVPPLPYPDVPFQWDCSGLAGASGAWVPMNFQTNVNRTGTEAAFTAGLVAAGRKPSFAKHATGGHGVVEWWAPGKPDYDNFVTNLLPAWLPDHPGPYRIAGVIWVGNEEDAQDAALVVQIHEKMAELAAGIRSHTGVPNLPIVAARTSSNQTGLPFRAQAQAQQDAWAANDPNVFLVNTDALTTTDGIHYYTPSIFTLGGDFAAVAPVP